MAPIPLCSKEDISISPERQLLVSSPVAENAVAEYGPAAASLQPPPGFTEPAP